MDRRELGMGFLINKDVAGSIEEFHSINEMVEGLVIRLNNRYTLKLAQAYAPKFSHDYRIVKSFYEDVESAMSKIKTQYIVPMGDFNAKAGKK